MLMMTVSTTTTQADMTATTPSIIKSDTAMDAMNTDKDISIVSIDR